MLRLLNVFINNLVTTMECTLSKFMHDTKWGAGGRLICQRAGLATQRPGQAGEMD